MTRILPMKITALLVLTLGAVLLAGCARSYTLTLNSGNRITTRGKPKLENGFYVYKDATGQTGAVPVGRVREVSPTSMTSSRVTSGYSAEPTK